MKKANPFKPSVAQDDSSEEADPLVSKLNREKQRNKNKRKKRKRKEKKVMQEQNAKIESIWR